MGIINKIPKEIWLVITPAAYADQMTNPGQISMGHVKAVSSNGAY